MRCLRLPDIPYASLTLALSISSVLLPAVSQTTQAGDWNFTGLNTAKATFVDNVGVSGASPYPFEGDMYYNETSIYFDRQDSDFASWRGELTGVYNLNDDYRTRDFGLTPERLNLTRTSGESLPYRAELGDYFAYYSYLTLQRSLKGLQFEVQPFTSNNRQHSIVFSSGANQSDWTELTPSDDYFNGASWLMQDRKLGSWSVNITNNFRDESGKLATLDRSQFVYSVAGEVPFQLASHQLAMELEAAHFNGDHDGLTGAASGQDRSDNGYLFQLRGNSRNLPLDYRFRFEHYGQDFRPQGAIVTSDRRSYELHAGWRFGAGIRARLRAQLFQDGYETANTLSTRTYGLNLSGPILGKIYPGLIGSLDAYIQNTDNELVTSSQLTQTLNLNLNAPLGRGWSGRLGMFIQNNENRLASFGDRMTRQLNIGVDRMFAINGWQGYFTPGLTMRTERKGGNYSNDISPSLALRINKDSHSINMNYGSLVQNRSLLLNGIDVDTHTFNLDYRFSIRRHTVGIEANLYNRQSQPGNSTEAYRVSLYWTMNLDRSPAGTVFSRRSSAPAVATVEAGALNISLNTLGPGATGADVRDQLAAANINQASEQGGFLVYEADVLPDIFHRQRLAMQFVGGVISRTVIIIDFDDVGNRDSNAQTYEQIRQSLIRELGSPARTYDEGEFSPNLVTDVNSQRFVRITEWNTPKGVIRFGIPRRLDGLVRMEIQHATAFMPPGDTLWSIDEVR